MRLRLCFTIVSLLAVALLGATAQEPTAWLFAGPCGGFSLGVQTGTVPVYAGSIDCGVFQPDATLGGWGGAQILLPRLVTSQIGLLAQLAWHQTSGTMEALPIDKQFVLASEGEEPVELDRRYRFKLTTSTLRLDLLARYQADGWGLSLGPWMGYRTNVSSEQTDNILGPDGLRHSDGQQAHIMTEGIAATPNRLAAGFVIAISHELPVGHSTRLIPQLAANAELTSPVMEAAIKRFSLDAGLALLFDLTPPPPPQPQPIVEIEPPPYVPDLSASIRLTSRTDGTGSERVTTVRASEVLYRKYTPLIPALFFGRDSIAFPSQYLHQIPSNTDSLMLSLRGMGALQVHQYMPDIIGIRMQKFPDSRLTIHGSTSLQESPALAAARAEVVRDYLVNTWNVPRSRITVSRSPGPISRSGESTEDGREENRRVEFSSNTGTLLGPIASERIVREYTPPAIDIVPDIHAEAGVRRWSITISQANTIVAQYASDDSVSITTGRTADRTWNIADDQIDSVPSPIRVELRVEDSTGAVVTAYDELPITMERRVRVVERQGEEDAEKITYRLVAFDYNSSEPAAGHIATLKEIATEIDSSTHVSVVGYTDRIGGEGFNVELSKRRAERVSELLQEQLQRRGIRTIPIVSTGAGIDAERFGNDTPQGRILSRGVLIMVVHDK